MSDDDRPTMDDRAAFEAYLNLPALVKGGRIAAHWLGDGRFWFVEGAPEATVITVFDPRTRKASPLFDVERTRAALRRIIGRQPPYSGLPFESFRQIRANEIIFAFEGADWRLDTSTYTVQEQPKSNSSDEGYAGFSKRAKVTPGAFARPWYFSDMPLVYEMLSPDRRCFVGLRNFNVWLRYTVDGRGEQITTDGEAFNGWDVEGIRDSPGGTFTDRATSAWSPDGFRLFATKFDSRAVGTLSRVHFLKWRDEVDTFPFSRAGDALAIVEPYVIDLQTRRTVRIAVDTDDRFLIFMGWRGDGRELYLMQFSRDMREATLYAADPTTGQARVIHGERGQTFIRIQHEVIGGRPGCTLLDDGQGFLWESERSGWKHLYRHDMNGKLLNAVTEGEWPIIDIVSVDLTAGQVYFTAHHDQARPYDVHLCRALLSGGAVERLTSSRGVHEIQMAPDHRCFIATVSGPADPPKSEVRSCSGELLHRFPPMDISGLAAVGWTPPEEFSVKAADGETDLWGVIYKPRNFDPAKLYPVLECVYGGPQIAFAYHGFVAFGTGSNSPANNTALAQLGYVVMVVDARGTPARSKAFQDVTYKDWRRHMTDDHAAAVRNLAAERSWMDLGRVGVFGHSWGAYSTVACMMDEPELYRVGVASSPGFDPYEGFLYEPYLGGTPCADNRAAYEDARLFNDAAKLHGRLMIVAGTNETGPWYGALNMSNVLIEAGKIHEFVVLPASLHSYGSTHFAYYLAKLVEFFERELKPLGESARGLQ